MATPFEIPLSPMAQRFTIQLAGTFYVLRFTWNVLLMTWVLDIANANDKPMACGIPLITGADLLAQYKYLGIGGQLIVQSDTDVNAVPTYANLGSIGHLYFIPDEA